MWKLKDWENIWPNLGIWRTALWWRLVLHTYLWKLHFVANNKKKYTCTNMRVFLLLRPSTLKWKAEKKKNEVISIQMLVDEIWGLLVVNRLWMQLLLCFCYISCYVLCLSDAKLNLVNRYIVYLSGFRFHLHKKKKKMHFYVALCRWRLRCLPSAHTNRCSLCLTLSFVLFGYPFYVS